ncbi:MAG: 2Fe-2S iron-sulfur cluster-binding protein [Gammaproteobacteria bacterium]
MGFFKNLLHGTAHTVTAEPSGRQFTVARNQSILEAALAQGIAFPHSCTVGTCGSCKCRLLSGKIREIANFGYVLSAEELQNQVILACQAAAKTDLTLEVPGLSDKQLHPAQDFNGVVREITDLTHDIKRITLELDRPLYFDAGQYAHLTVPEVWGARAYSFAIPPAAEGNAQVSFFIRRIPGGAFTEWLFDTDRSGQSFEVHGPTGNFWLRPSRAPMIGIAGGSGLAPLLSILRDAVARQVGRPCTVLFGARAERDLYALDELAEIGRGWNGSFNFLPVLSDLPADSTWTGARGLVTAQIDRACAGLLVDDAEAYLCGPPPMVDAAIGELTARGLAPQNIHFDKFLDGSHGLQRQG